MFGINRQISKRVNGAIFDLDGTILDTMEQWDTLGLRYLKEHNIEPNKDFLDRIGTMSLRESAEYFHQKLNLGLDINNIIDELVKRLRIMYSREARLKPGVIDVLRLLKRNDVEITLATATSRDLAIDGLKLNGILEFFAGVFSCRDTNIRENKTSPKIYDYARRFMGTIPQETIVVEDALYAIETAKRAGYFVIAIEDRSERTRKKEIMSTADVYVEDHDSLRDWLQMTLQKQHSN